MIFCVFAVLFNIRRILTSARNVFSALKLPISGQYGTGRYPQFRNSRIWELCLYSTQINVSHHATFLRIHERFARHHAVPNFLAIDFQILPTVDFTIPCLLATTLRVAVLELSHNLHILLQRHYCSLALQWESWCTLHGGSLTMYRLRMCISNPIAVPGRRTCPGKGCLDKGSLCISENTFL